jgi:hypothetical protein
MGRFAIVTDAGRDAVDADGSFDEWRYRGRRSRVVLMPRCWHQPGDEASASRRGRWQTSPVAEESAEETVKTIARGMPGEPGVPAVTMLVCFFISHTRLRARSSARHSLRPLISEGSTLGQNSRVGAARSQNRGHGREVV